MRSERPSGVTRQSWGPGDLSFVDPLDDEHRVASTKDGGVRARLLALAGIRGLSLPSEIRRDFDPSLHPHAPSGSAIGGQFIPTKGGGGRGALTDALKIAGKIDLADGEELLGSSKVDGDSGGARLALIRGTDGRHRLRIGLGMEGYGKTNRDEGTRAWDGNPSRPALPAAERERLQNERDDLDAEWDNASPDRKAAINRRMDEIHEQLTDDGEFNGTTDLDPVDARRLVAAIRPVMEAAAQRDKEYTRTQGEVDELKKQRIALRRKVDDLGREWTNEEDSEWARLTEEIDRREAILDGLVSGPNDPYLVEGTIPGAQGDVHYYAVYEEPSLAYGGEGKGGGPYISIGVMPRGETADDWGASRDWQGSFDVAETRKLLKQIEQMVGEGDSGRSTEGDWDERAYFDEDEHPRGSGATGGQFVAKNSGGGGSKTSTKSNPKPKAKTPQAPRRKPKPKRPGALESGTGMGSGGPDDRVRRLQIILNRFGLKVGVDGKFGPDTAAAVKKAQKHFGLPADGRVTVDVIRKLWRESNMPDAKTNFTGAKTGKTASGKKCTCRSALGECEQRSCGRDILAELRQRITDLDPTPL